MLLVLLTVYGFKAASAEIDTGAGSFTVPTRTPFAPPTDTPEPQKPTESPDQGGNNGGDQNSTPEPTPLPPTATPIPVTLAPTPVDGFVSPKRCGNPFFVANLGTVNVRQQPTTDSEIVGKMVYLEARQILGRFADDAWWQILLPDTSLGWVYDSTGSMIGILEIVPLINADGSPATDPIWQPTPDLFCPTLTPTNEPTITPSPTIHMTPSATPEPTATEASTAVDDSSDNDSLIIAAITVTIDPNAISPLPEQLGSAVLPADINDRGTSLKPEFTGEEISNANSNIEGLTSLFSWPLILGFLLILFGVVALIFQRKQEIVA